MKKETHHIKLEITDNKADIQDILSEAARHIEAGEITAGSLSDGFCTVSWGNHAHKPSNDGIEGLLGYLSCVAGIPSDAMEIISSNYRFKDGYARAYEAQVKMDHDTELLED